MNSKKIRIVIIIIFFLAGKSAVAGLYKWTNDEGVVTYSQDKPADKKWKIIETPTKNEKSDIRESVKSFDKQKLVIDSFIGKERHLTKEEVESLRKIKTNTCLIRKDLVNYIEMNIPIYLSENNRHYPKFSSHYHNDSGDKKFLSESETANLSDQMEKLYNLECLGLKEEVQNMENERDRLKDIRLCEKAKVELIELKKSDRHTIREEINSFKNVVKSMCKKVKR